MIQSAVMGALSIVIGGDVSGLDKAAAKAELTVAKLTKGLNAQVTQLATYASVAAAAGAALAVGLLAKSMDTIDAQSKLAHRLNGTVAELQSLVHAADLAGVSQDALATAVGRMNVKLAEAARTGSGPAYEALQRLGLSAKDFLALPVNERLATLADRYKDLGYSTAQQADSLKQLGVKGQEIINLFEGGGDGIRDATKDVEAFGVAISDIDAATVESANDAWTTARLALTGIGNQLSITLAPLIKDVGDKFADAGRESHGFAEAIQQGVLTAVIMFGRVQKEIYTTRLDLDQMSADFFSNWNAIVRVMRDEFPKLSGDLGLRQIEHNFGNLKHTLEKPPSDDDWKAWFEKINAEAKEAAKKVIEEREKTKPGGDTGDGLDENERRALQNRLDRLRKSIASEDEQKRIARDDELKDLKEFEDKKIISAQEAAAIRLQIEDKYRKDLQDLVASRFEDSVATEDELLARKYAKQLEDLQKFEDNKTLTVEQAADIRRKIEEKAKQASIQIQAAQYSALAGIVDTSMSDITSLVGDEGDKQFSIFKAISAATALVKGYEAVVSAYAAGSKIGGPAVGAVFAGIAAAGVAAHIAKLMAVNVNSAGGGGSVAAAGGGGGGDAASAASQPAAPQQSLFLSINGNFFGREQVRELAGKLIDFQNDGGKVVLA